MSQLNKIMYSIVIPVYNEAGNLAALYQSLQDKLLSRGDACEVVFVDDGRRKARARRLQT